MADLAVFLFGGLAAAAAGTMLLLMAGRRPQLFLGVLTASAFFSRIVIHLGSLGLRIETALGLIATATLVLQGTRRPLSRSGGATWALLLAWIVFLAFSTFMFSGNKASSFAIVFWLLTDVGIALYVAKHSSYWRTIVSVGVWASAICIALGVALWIVATNGGPRFLVHPDPTYGGYAVYLLTHEANILAGTVVIFAAICLTRFSNHLPARLRLFVIAGTPVLALATHTRTAIVALAAAAIVTGIAQRKVAKTIGASLAVVLLVFALGFTSTALPNLAKFGELGDLSGGTGAYRLNAINTAIDDLSRSPLAVIFGHGANTFGINHLDPSLPALMVPWYLPNLPAQIIYDSGLIGFTLVASAFLIMFRHRLRGADPIIAAALVTSLTTSQLWLVQSWLLVGLAVAATRQKSAAPPALPIDETAKSATTGRQPRLLHETQ